MRKNGSRLISVKQYRLTDLFLFALILVVSELLAHFAAVWFRSEAIFTLSLAVPITLIVMIRWGWQGAFYPILSGLVYCLFNVKTASGNQWACYIVGNAFVALMLIPVYLIGAKRITAKWWRCALFAVGGWLCMYLGRSSVWAVAYCVHPVSEAAAASGFAVFAACDSISLLMTVVILLVLRRLNGMLERQTDYIKRLDDEEREKAKVMQDGGLAEIDEEALRLLNNENDLYK